MTGLEWEDPLHVNVLSGTETRKLNLIITQIAVLVSKKKIVLRPYFQDYELVRSRHTASLNYYIIYDIITFIIYSLIFVFSK